MIKFSVYSLLLLFSLFNYGVDDGSSILAYRNYVSVGLCMFRALHTAYYCLNESAESDDS